MKFSGMNRLNTAEYKFIIIVVFLTALIMINCIHFVIVSPVFLPLRSKNNHERFVDTHSLYTFIFWSLESADSGPEEILPTAK